MSRHCEELRPLFFRGRSILQQHRLELAAFHGRFYCFAEKVKVALEREGLLVRRVLPEGDEVHVLALQKRRDALRGAGETVVCGNGENERRAVSQMRLARHCDGGIRDAAGKLCERAARARRDEQRISFSMASKSSGEKVCSLSMS